jgi:hypothetical protein
VVPAAGGRGAGPGGAQRQTQLLASFPTTLQQLELRSSRPVVLLIVDLAALAAGCPQLRDLRLSIQPASLQHASSSVQWPALESLDLYVDSNDSEEQQQAYAEIIKATSSQMPRLHALELRGLQLSTSSEQWQQLASIPSLRSLRLDTLRVDDTAAPSASIRRLTAALAVQLPGDQLDGSLAVMLPALEQLHTSTDYRAIPACPTSSLLCGPCAATPACSASVTPPTGTMRYCGPGRRSCGSAACLGCKCSSCQGC